jgi:TrmH family RNA methyltransferase
MSARQQGQEPFQLIAAAKRVKTLTLARDLKRRRARERHGLFVAEGVRAVEELLSSGLAVRALLVSPQLLAAPRGRELRARAEASGVAVTDVGEAEFASAADTDTPQGVLAIAGVPAVDLAALELSSGASLVVLDGVQDPGNVGAILRTAAALGAAATVALPGTVDVWNAKVVRSAMGAHFHHPAASCTADELDAFLSARGIPLWGADARGAPVATLARPRAVALAVGNEGAGLSPSVRARVAQLVSLPIASRVESLNVAVATGILLYELRR